MALHPCFMACVSISPDREPEKVMISGKDEKEAIKTFKRYMNTVRREYCSASIVEPLSEYKGVFWTETGLVYGPLKKEFRDAEENDD